MFIVTHLHNPLTSFRCAMNGYTHMQGALSTGIGHSGRAGEDSEEDYENVENVRRPTSRGSILVENFAIGAFGVNEQQTVSDHEHVNTERRQISADVSRSYLRAKGASHYDPQGEGTVGKNYVNVELTPMNTAKASIVDSGASCSTKTENPLIVDTKHSEAGQAGGLYANFSSKSTQEICKLPPPRESVNLSTFRSNSSAPSDSDQVHAGQVSKEEKTSGFVGESGLQPCETLTKDVSPASSSCPKEIVQATKLPVVVNRHHALVLACLLVVFALNSICSGILAGIAFNKAISTNVDYPLQWQALSSKYLPVPRQRGKKMKFGKWVSSVSQRHHDGAQYLAIWCLGVRSGDFKILRRERV